ncbi:MAG: AtpZ/AtpI family protein [Bacteroidota bacterium]
MRYAGLGFETLACILLFAGLGYKLDQWMETAKPWYLLVCTLLGVALAMYLMIRKLMPGKKEERGSRSEERGKHE